MFLSPIGILTVSAELFWYPNFASIDPSCRSSTHSAIGVIGIGVGVSVGIAVGVTVDVAVAVLVGVIVGVLVTVAVAVLVGVTVGVGVGASRMTAVYE